MSLRVTDVRLRVDPTACDAFGYCAELVPELVGVDEWGYPIVCGDPVPVHLYALTRRAVRECPRRALFLERVERAPQGARDARRR